MQRSSSTNGAVSCSSMLRPKQLFGYSRDELTRAIDRDAGPRTLPQRASRTARCVQRDAPIARPMGAGRDLYGRLQRWQRSAHRDRAQSDQDRRRDLHARRDYRHHGTQACRRVTPAPHRYSATCRRARGTQPRTCERLALQNAIRRNDEPRVAHAAHGDHRGLGALEPIQARCARADVRANDRRVGRGTVCVDQQHPRLLEDRSREAGSASRDPRGRSWSSRARRKSSRSWLATRESRSTRTSIR